MVKRPSVCDVSVAIENSALALAATGLTPATLALFTTRRPWDKHSGNDTDFADANEVLLIGTLTGVTIANAAAMVAANFQL